MHNLVNRALESFVSGIYGRDIWLDIASTAMLGFETFEPLVRYDRTVTETVIKATAFELGKPRDVLLEDLGLYLVTHPSCEAIRRLMRFGGDDFASFLESLEELPDRARLAFPDLRVPILELHQVGERHYMLLVVTDLPGTGSILLGCLRGMADDYGTLATIEWSGIFRGRESLAITVIDTQHAEGREFDLAGRCVA